MGGCSRQDARSGRHGSAGGKWQARRDPRRVESAPFSRLIIADRVAKPDLIRVRQTVPDCNNSTRAPPLAGQLRDFAAIL